MVYFGIWYISAYGISAYGIFQGFTRATTCSLGRAWRFQNLTSRFGSGQGVLEISRVSSGRLRSVLLSDTDRAGAARIAQTREKAWIYHTIQYHTILYHTIPYSTIPYHTIPYHTIPYHTIPYLTIPYHTVPYHTIPYQVFCDVTLWGPLLYQV